MRAAIRISGFLISAFWVFAAASSSAPLKITRLQVERFEDGSPVFSPEAFAGGETVFFSLQMEGFSQRDNTVRLTFEARAKDSAGTLLTVPVDGEEAAKLTPEDKNWQPKLRGSLVLPGVLGAGDYKISLLVKDELSGQTASGEIPFAVSGIKFDPAPDLAIRNLAFYHGEDDTRPLDIAAYRISEEIYARFQVVGFGHGEQGAVDVSYGVSIADAAGKVLFGDPVAAEDKSSEFYPKPYVPGILSFHLKPGTPPGEYVLTVTATDMLNHHKIEAHRSFRLE